MKVTEIRQWNMGGCGIIGDMKKGKITPNGVSLEKHEYDTVLFFTELGCDVELLPRSNRAGDK